MSARLRQAVIAARDLEAVAGRLRDELELGEPFSEPGVGYFGLRNVVFALGNTFLEVVSPARPDTAAGRLLRRRGGDCGYMLMFEVDDVAAARARAAHAGVREVFAVELDDMVEAHLHPADMRAAIVSVSQPVAPGEWRWGGPDWRSRAAPLHLAGATVAVGDPDAVRGRWEAVLDGLPSGICVAGDAAEPGLVEIRLAGAPERLLDLGSVRVVVCPDDQEDR